MRPKLMKHLGNFSKRGFNFDEHLLGILVVLWYFLGDRKTPKRKKTEPSGVHLQMSLLALMVMLRPSQLHGQWLHLSGERCIDVYCEKYLESKLLLYIYLNIYIYIL